MKCSSEEFQSGFLITKEALSLSHLSNYYTCKIGEYNIIYGNQVDILKVESSNGKAILIGYCLDIRNGELTDKDILNSLLKSNKVVDDLEYISGRYIVIIQKDKELTVYSDASQLRPLVYHKDSMTLASHDNLLALFLKGNNFEVIRRPSEVYNELDFTRYEKIWKYNPSLSLKLSHFNFERIYPRNKLKTLSIEGVTNRIQPYLDEMVKWLGNIENRDVFLSLTAGIDSRVSAALTNSLSGKIEYLTYFMPSSHIPSKKAKLIYRIDEFVTESMKENLKWNHSIIDLTEYRFTDEDHIFFKKFYNSKHGYRLSNYYKYYKKYNKALHIKSTVYGLGKADFPKSLDTRKNSYDYYIESIHGLSKVFQSEFDIKKEAMGYFERNLVELGVTRGRYYYDLYHLESRMGNWHSSLTHETDPETEEFIFMNSRKLIDLIQQPTLKDKRDFKLYKKLIENNWPVLLFFGINQKENLYEEFTEDSNILENNLEISNIYNLHINKISDSKIEIKPDTSDLSIHDYYNCKIKNNKNLKRNLFLRSTYSNPNGRGNIFVLIRSKDRIEKFDVLDLNNGLDISLSNDEISISIIYNKNYSSASWRTAGQLFIEEKE